MIKLCGGILIVLACGWLGFQIAASFCLEKQMLRQWISALDYMQCELQYRMTSLPEICRQAAENGKGKIRLLLYFLADELDRQVAPDVRGCMENALGKAADLPRSEYHSAKELGDTLGRFDTDGQVRQLEAVRQNSRKHLEALEKDSGNRIRAYQTLGLCGGAAIAILLI